MLGGAHQSGSTPTPSRSVGPGAQRQGLHSSRGRGPSRQQAGCEIFRLLERDPLEPRQPFDKGRGEDYCLEELNHQPYGKGAFGHQKLLGCTSNHFGRPLQKMANPSKDMSASLAMELAREGFPSPCIPLSRIRGGSLVSQKIGNMPPQGLEVT